MLLHNINKIVHVPVPRPVPVPVQVPVPVDRPYPVHVNFLLRLWDNTHDFIYKYDIETYYSCFTLI